MSKRVAGASPTGPDRSFDHRLLAYALGGGATVLAGGTAEATPISSGIQNIQVASIGAPNEGNYVHVHLDPNDINSPYMHFGWDHNATPYGPSGGSVAGIGTGSSQGFQFMKASAFSAANYAAGTLVDSTVPVGMKTWGNPAILAWYNSDNTYNGTPGAPLESNWSAGGSGYVAFRWNDGVGNHYGWAEVSVPTSSAVGENVTLVQWAYESDADTPILIQSSPVPEIDAGSASSAVAVVAGGLGLLEQMGFATGAAGLRAWRKRRRASV